MISFIGLAVQIESASTHDPRTDSSLDTIACGTWAPLSLLRAWSFGTMGVAPFAAAALVTAAAEEAGVEVWLHSWEASEEVSF